MIKVKIRLQISHKVNNILLQTYFSAFLYIPPTADKLEANQRRWLIVGICLHSIISTVLREIIQPVLEHEYDILVKSNNIDKQTHGDFVKKYPANSSYKLNYKSINNNKEEKHGPKFCDYKVKNSVDYSKLYLHEDMAMYTGIDETCDLSALFGILLNSGGFAQDVKKNANQVLLLFSCHI